MNLSRASKIRLTFVLLCIPATVGAFFVMVAGIKLGWAIAQPLSSGLLGLLDQVMEPTVIGVLSSVLLGFAAIITMVFLPLLAALAGPFGVGMAMAAVYRRLRDQPGEDEWLDDLALKVRMPPRHPED